MEKLFVQDAELVNYAKIVPQMISLRDFKNVASSYNDRDSDAIIESEDEDSSETESIKQISDHSVEISNNKKLQAQQNILPSKNTYEERNEKICLKHGSMINDMYCSYCKLRVCERCIISGNHVSHSIESFAENFDNVFNKGKTLFDKLSNNCKLISDMNENKNKFMNQAKLEVIELSKNIIENGIKKIKAYLEKKTQLIINELLDEEHTERQVNKAYCEFVKQVPTISSIGKNTKPSKALMDLIEKETKNFENCSRFDPFFKSFESVITFKKAEVLNSIEKEIESQIDYLISYNNSSDTDSVDELYEINSKHDDSDIEDKINNLDQDNICLQISEDNIKQDNPFILKLNLKFLNNSFSILEEQKEESIKTLNQESNKNNGPLIDSHFSNNIKPSDSIPLQSKNTKDLFFTEIEQNKSNEQTNEIIKNQINKDSHIFKSNTDKLIHDSQDPQDKDTNNFLDEDISLIKCSTDKKSPKELGTCLSKLIDQMILNEKKDKEFSEQTESEDQTKQINNILDTIKTSRSYDDDYIEDYEEIDQEYCY